MDLSTSPRETPTRSTGLGRLSPRTQRALLGTCGVAGFIVFLQVLPSIAGVEATFLPPFSAILTELLRQAGTSTFWSALGSTLTGWAIGLVISMVAGIVLGIIIGSVPVLRNGTASTIEFLRPIPSVALIPLAVLLYGTGMTSTLLLVVYAGFWQVLIQVQYGVRDVDPVARETARSYRLSTWRQIRTVIWPTTLPFVLTGFRLAATVCLVLELTGELIIGSPGLGQQINLAQAGGNNTILYALVLLTGVLGVLVNLGARAVQKRLMSWHPSVRKEAAQ